MSSIGTALTDLAVTSPSIPVLEWPDPQEKGLIFTAPLKESHAFGKQSLRYAIGGADRGEITEANSVIDGQDKREKNLLVVSPYSERSHLLDLSSVEQPSQLLARALTNLQQVRPDYATAPYDKAFNWSDVVDDLRSLLAAEHYVNWEEQRFYIVVFRSQLDETTDNVRSRLGELDKLAHQEATKAGGLLKYWFGTPDPAGVWRRHSDAKAGGTGDGHAKAMREALKLYTKWEVQRLSLNIGKNAASWSITKWVD